jgi:NAD(P)-dependent dehydrogenase (short-subunit alcohol dehydrogenase family)
MSGDKKLNGKVALITGATSGIGRAAAILFASEGAKVVAVGRRKQKGEELVSLIKKQGGEASFFQADVSKTAD